MIPRTYPTTYLTANGKQQMMVYFLGSVEGLERWSDYIPVKASSAVTVKENSYDNDGVILVKDIGSTFGKQAWKDYIPVYVDPLATDAWKVDIDGFIPTFPTPSLSLDFTSSSETLDPRITFSRTTNATRVNSQGLIEYAPHNLLLNSETFNSSWIRFGTTTLNLNTVTAPNGTTTADNIVFTSASAGIYQAITGTALTTYVFSVYIKSSSSTQVNLVINTNLADPTIQTVSVTSGWNRFSITKTTSSGTTSVTAQIQDTGSGNSQFDIWGAQLNVGALQPYYPTTVKNLLGFSEAFENAAWTKSNSFIQTNLLTWSQDFDNAAWGKPNSDTISANLVVAPNNTTTADTFVETSATSLHTLLQDVTVVGGTTYTLTFFAKAAGRSIIQSRLVSVDDSNGVVVEFNISTGSVATAAVAIGTGGNASASITPVGDGWYRCVTTGSMGASVTACRIRLRTLETAGGSTTIAGLNGNAYHIWGAQLVQGSTPGDYQQTFSAALPVMYKAPNGLMTADKLVETTAAGEHAVGVPISFIAGQIYTQSVYAKAAERTLIRVGAGNPATWATGVVVDLSTGTITSTIAGSGTVQSVGDGWYRVSVTGTALATAATNASVRLVSTGTTVSYTGDGTSGIYIWGAQLSDSASLDTYVNNPGAAPTSTAYYGPRFDYDPVTLQPKGLLIEEQSTNVQLYSEDYSDPAFWLKDSITTTIGQPAPNNTNTATKHAQTNNTTAVVGGGISNQPTISSGETVTFSQYLKSDTAQWIVLQIGPNSASSSTSRLRGWFDIKNGVVGGVSNVGAATGASISIQPAPNGYFRCSITGALNDGLTSCRVLLWAAAGNNSIDRASTNAGAYIMWGSQVERKAFATSYIPTVAAQVTRAADVATITGSNFSGWFNASEGCIQIQVNTRNLGGTIYPGWFAIDNNTINEVLTMFAYNTELTSLSRTSSANVFVYTKASTVPTTPSVIKAALSYKDSNYIAAYQGTTPFQQLSGAVPTGLVQMRIGSYNNRQINGHIQKINYYPQALQQLQNITS